MTKPAPSAPSTTAASESTVPPAPLSDDGANEDGANEDGANGGKEDGAEGGGKRDGAANGGGRGAWADELCLVVTTARGVLIVALDHDGSYTVGRAVDSDIPLQDKTVSRTHARIVREGRRVFLTDLNGANGTLLNGRKIEPGTPTPVPTGAAIEIGAATLLLQRQRGLLNDDGTPNVSMSSRRPVRPAASDSSARVVRDPRMVALYKSLDLVGPSMLSVLIMGETGTGKEVFAEAVHAGSERADKPFVQLNCAAVPEMLFESEVFGHEKGAYTSAVERKEGIFESADGGTVFLDEVGEIPLRMQAKLLRVLETREVQRLGSNRARRVDVRFIAATNRDLRALAAQGAFRQDLFFRLNGTSVVIPPLRSRKDDILPLAAYFVAGCAGKAGRRPPSISREAAEHLLYHPWPGNVRELRNVMEHAVVICRDGPILQEHLELGEDTRLAWSTLPGSASVPPSSVDSPSRPPRGSNAPTGKPGLGPQVEAFEKQLILDALEQCDGNQTKTARVLGISRRVLLLRLEHYGVSKQRKDEEP